MKRLIALLIVSLALAPASAAAQTTKQPPRHEPCQDTCVKRLTLKPGQQTSWTIPHRFRVDREQAFSLYIGRSSRNRMDAGGEMIRCSYFVQGAGVLLRIDAAGCRTHKRVRFRVTAVSLRRTPTRLRVAVIDRPYPPPEVSVPDPVEYDSWGRPDTDVCYSIPPEDVEASECLVP
jgi:hypothetical protein